MGGNLYRAKRAYLFGKGHINKIKNKKNKKEGEISGEKIVTGQSEKSIFGASSFIWIGVYMRRIT